MAYFDFNPITIYFRSWRSFTAPLCATRSSGSRYNWSYVSIVHDESSYGRRGAYHVEQLGRSRRLCFPVQLTLPTSASNDTALYAQLVERLLDFPQARGNSKPLSWQRMQSFLAIQRGSGAVSPSHTVQWQLSVGWACSYCREGNLYVTVSLRFALLNRNLTYNFPWVLIHKHRKIKKHVWCQWIVVAQSEVCWLSV